jgi:SpoVK/Ycf46/Vps4 family AAA+-type ATPase
MGQFKLKSKINLMNMEVGSEQTLPTSDYATLLPDGTFAQFEYNEEDRPMERIKVKPGVWSFAKTMSGIKLTPTNFVSDKLLDSFTHTDNITQRINRFFERVNVYYEEGIEVPKRGMIIYGPPGSGKSSAINKVCNTYALDGKTAIVVWHTDKYEAHTVKDVFKALDYVDGVERLILVVEDIGGVEQEGSRRGSESSLLSILDNQEKTFTIPTLILATTNYPEMFLANLMNRPQRFDDKIEVGYPSADDREALLNFYTKNTSLEVDIKAIRSDKCKVFTPAHIKEVKIRSRIYDKTIAEVIEEMVKEIELYNRAFTKRNKLGMGGSYD